MRKYGVRIFAALAGAMLICTAAAADGDAVEGKQKSVVCASCHGVSGESVMPDYPVLAGQHQDYLEHTLKAYRSGERSNPIMAAFVATLSDADIADLAAYYAAQEGLFTLSR
ncbi:MAG: cytochrome c [Proteobacteria bacterium]|nr:cytochrome c [Pseudomonadota bacterium]